MSHPRWDPLHTQPLQGALSFSLELLLPTGTTPPNRCFLQFCNKAEINLEMTLLRSSELSPWGKNVLVLCH